jgi:deoxyuridine 5'-triphosphate nucleotidohydrolase
MLKFCKVRNVRTPERGTSRSSGVDLYIPYYSEEMKQTVKQANNGISNVLLNEDCIVINPFCHILIPMGIKVFIPEGYDLVMHNKSRLASVQGLIYGAHVIDADYEGEVFASIINTNQYSREVSWGQKLIQCILREVNLETWQECSEEEMKVNYNGRKSERGEGALGSTGI